MPSFLRILVVSDSHGDRRSLRRILDLHGEAACVFHLGDGAADMEALAEDYPTAVVYGVAGNCDSRLRLFPEEQEVLVGGKRIFAAHGHAFGVKHSPLRFAHGARQRQADIALFGHTHQPLLHREDGLILLNPGSVMQGGHYALVDITDGGVLPHLEQLRY